MIHNTLHQLLSKQNQDGDTSLYMTIECRRTLIVKEMLQYMDLETASIKVGNGYKSFHMVVSKLLRANI